MIGKTKTGTGFKGAVYYCLQNKKTPEILDLNGLSHTDAKGLTREFNAIYGENPNISKPVWHSSLSFTKQDNMTNDKMVEIANRFMEKAGFTKDNNQFVIIKHNDREHTHCHIIANRVGFDGKAVSDYYCKSKTVQWSKEIEKEYNLTRVQELAQKKRIEKAMVNGKDLSKEQIKDVLIQTLKQPGIKTLNELAKGLLPHGIDMQLKHAKTGIDYGVSFSKNGITYKGSDIGKQFAFKALSQVLSPANIAKEIAKTVIKGISLGI